MNYLECGICKQRVEVHIIRTKSERPFTSPIKLSVILRGVVICEECFERIKDEMELTTEKDEEGVISFDEGD